jgi:hypothetical protein
MYTLLACIGLLLTSCGSEGVSGPDLAMTYAAVLSADFGARGESVPAGSLLLVRQASLDHVDLFGAMDPTSPTLAPLGPEPEWESLCVALPDLRRETWDSFVDANCESVDLACEGIRYPHLVWLPEDEARRVFASGVDAGYSLLRRNYPGFQMLLALSRPGVSADGDQALLYVEGSSGELAGSAYYYFLVRAGSSWRVSERVEAWIA